MYDSVVLGSLGKSLGSPEVRAAAAAVICGGLGLSLIMSSERKPPHWAGVLLGLGGLFFFWSLVQRVDDLTHATAFWIMASLAIGSSVATISARSPVYSAIWFAASLLGTGGLFLLQGAQFLGIATVAVYAGAIVVTFLFVLMLAQPEGQTFYDRISWGGWPRVVAPLLAAFFVGIAGFTFGQFADPGSDVQNSKMATKASASIETSRPPFWNFVRLSPSHGDVQSTDHVANLGAQLFGRHLIAVEVAGCLLMAALVGALAIASHGSDSTKPTESASS